MTIDLEGRTYQGFCGSIDNPEVDFRMASFLLKFMKYDSKNKLFTAVEESSLFRSSWNGRVIGNNLSAFLKINSEIEEKWSNINFATYYLNARIDGQTIQGVTSIMDEKDVKLSDDQFHETKRFPNHFYVMFQIQPGENYSILEETGEIKSDNQKTNKILEQNQQRAQDHFEFWKDNEGKEYLEMVETRERNYRAWVEKNNQDTLSEMRRIFPPSMREDPEKHIRSFLGEKEINSKTEDLGWVFYPGGAENEISRNYALETEDTFDYEPHQIPRFALTDEGAISMSRFLGCIPEESERCYSIIRFISENKKSEIPLGFSEYDMRDYIGWMINPTNRITLFM